MIIMFYLSGEKIPCSRLLKNECDKPLNNKMIVTGFVTMEQSMNDNHYKQITKNQEGMEVVIEFPEQTQNDDSIKQEVKMIMLSVLHEYYDSIS